MCNSFDVVVAVIFLIFYISPSTALLSEDAVDKRALKHTFNKLLYDLIDLNQQRLNAINKVLLLEDRPLTLRSSGEAGEVEEASASLSSDKDPLIVYLVKQNGKNDKDKYTSEYISSAIVGCLRSQGLRDLSDSFEEGLDIATSDADIDKINDNKAAERSGVLRGWSDCRKTASRACRKACVAASKNVCKDYRCNSRMKKAFRKECKANCNDRFSNA